ncbi:MAG: polysaccharide deacetylase family protein [Anaerolineae bacterium]
MRRTLCISVDLDPLACYRRIYGLPLLDPPAGGDPVLVRALPRACDLLDRLGATGTFFAVGDSPAAPAAAAALAAAARRGHEIGNHTWSHPYDLTRLDEEAIDAQVRRGAEAIQQACGAWPRGFRAPGYLLGPRVLPRLADAGVAYDASALPSPLYQGVKAAAVLALRSLGKSSRAVLGDPREALGPAGPYRPDLRRPWRRGRAPLWELPISAPAGLPLTGALLALAGARGARLLAALAARRRWVHLELHGVDLLDLRTDGLDPALGVQADLRVGWEKKREAIGGFIASVARTHRIVTLAQVAGEQGDR